MSSDEGIHTALYEVATGRIVRSQLSWPEPPPVEEGYALLIGEYIPSKTYVVDGRPVDRPDLMLEPHDNLRAGQPWRISVPTGTRIYVDNELIGISGEDEVDELPFPFAGSWFVHLDPPFPYRAAAFTIEVLP